MNIFFDLDGTLLDSSDRLYDLFCDLIPQNNITKSEYWNLKRNKINHKNILLNEFNYSEEEFINFEQTWLAKIETEKYLLKDKLKINTDKILKNLSKNNNLFIVSARQSKINAINELKRLNIINFFKEIFITENKYTKEELIKNFYNIDKNIFIGDTGYDILTGKNLNMLTIAICDGFLSKEKLIEYKPDYLIDTINKIENILERLKNPVCY